MGNKTNTENWSARERLIYIERLAYWRGWVRRTDVCEKFGISTPQASADLAEYLRRNPRSLRYNLSRKRYEATTAMRPAFDHGTLDEAIQLFSGGTDSIGIDRVARIDLPERRITDQVTRDLVRAVLAATPIRIYYFSINSGTEGWRIIRPHAFAHDGYRWHTRAWCQEDCAYKDFVLGRIEKVRPAELAEFCPPPDEEWQTKVTVQFQAHRDLTPTQQAALEKDFAMVRGVGTLRVRKALLFYTLAYLGLSEPGPIPLRRLQLLQNQKI